MQLIAIIAGYNTTVVVSQDAQKKDTVDLQMEPSDNHNSSHLKPPTSANAKSSAKHISDKTMGKTQTDCKTVARLCSDIAKLGDSLVAEHSTRRHSVNAGHPNDTDDIGTKGGQGNMLQVPGAANSTEKRRSKSVSEIEPEMSSAGMMSSRDTARPRSGSASKRSSSFGFHRSRSGSRKGSRKRKGSTASRTSGTYN